MSGYEHDHCTRNEIELQAKLDSALRLISEITAVCRAWQSTEKSDASAIVDVCALVKASLKRSLPVQNDFRHCGGGNCGACCCGCEGCRRADGATA